MERHAESYGEHGIVIELLAAGTRAPDWVVEGFGEYEKRLPRDWRLELREVPVARRTHRKSNRKDSGAELARLQAEEGEKMMAAIRPGSRVVALDSGGTIWSTEQLADNFERWSLDTKVVQFMIGGPDGLARECLDRADNVWSLSRLTLPHFMVRVLLAEQVYRAWAILNNHPYHK